MALQNKMSKRFLACTCQKAGGYLEAAMQILHDLGYQLDLIGVQWPARLQTQRK